MANRIGFLHDYGLKHGQIISESDSSSVYGFETTKTNRYADGDIRGTVSPDVWWKLDEAPGTGSVTDYGPAGANGVTGGAITQGETGYKGLCVMTTGTAGRVYSLPDDSGGNHPTTRNFTCTFWLKKPYYAYHYDNRVFFFRYVRYQAGIYLITHGYSDPPSNIRRMRAVRYVDGIETVCNSSQSIIMANGWHHIGFAHSDSGQFMKFWINGVEDGYTSWLSYDELNFTTIEQSYIGVGTTRACSPNNTYIDEYKFYANKILTTEQILADMAS
jgi:hypothetical protein